MHHIQKVIWIQGLLDFSISAYFIFISWLLYLETENAIYTGLFVGLGFLPSFVCIPFFGVFVDRYNKKWLLLYAFLIMLVTILAVFSTIQFIHPVFLIISHMLIQICGSLIRPAMQAFISKLFPKEQFITVFSKSATFTIIGGILGTSISSLLVSKFLVIGLAFIVLIPIVISIYMLSKLPLEKTMTVRIFNPIFKDIGAGFTYCFSNRFFIQLIILLAIGQLIYHTTVGFLAAFTYDILKSGATIYGLLEIAISIGGILAGILSARFMKLFNSFFPIALTVLLTLCLFQLTTSSSIVLTFLSCIGIGYCTTAIRTTFQAIQQMATEEQYHGRVASIRMFFNQGSVVCFTPILGFLAQHTSLSNVFALLTCFSVLSIFISLFLNKHDECNAFHN